MRADIPPGDLWVIEQYTTPECPPNPVTFFRAETVGVQNRQNAIEQRVILGDFGFDRPEPRFQLDRGEKVRLLKLKSTPLIVASPKNPVPFTPFLQVSGPTSRAVETRSRVVLLSSK